MEISPDAIKELRQRTGVGVMDCKKALLECAGNVNEAIDIAEDTAGARKIANTSRLNQSPFGS